MHDSDDQLADVIHVEDRRVSVQTNRMELVRILHRYSAESFEVFFEKSFFDCLQTSFNNMLSTMLQQ
jgi:hypothetical protein